MRFTVEFTNQDGVNILGNTYLPHVVKELYNKFLDAKNYTLGINCKTRMPNVLRNYMVMQAGGIVGYIIVRCYRD